MTLAPRLEPRLSTQTPYYQKLQSLRNSFLSFLIDLLYGQSKKRGRALFPVPKGKRLFQMALHRAGSNDIKPAGESQLF